MPERTYSEREIAAILARASEAAGRQTRDEGAGLTLREIQHAAAESGLDGDLVRQAAADLDAGLLPLRTDRPGTTIVERWVDAPFRLEVWEDAVAALRLQAGGAQGEVSHVGESYEWAHTTTFGSRTTVTVSPRGGRTRLRVVTVDEVGNARLQATVFMAVFSALPGLLLGAAVAEGLGWGDLAGVAALVLTVVLATAFGAPVVEGWTHRRRARQTADAARIVEDLAQRFGAPERAPAHPTGSTPRLDLSVLDDEPAESAPSQTRGRTRL